MQIHLKAARINARMTLAAAAQAAGISKGTLANYEAYKTMPDIKTAKALAAIYNMSVDDIIFFPVNCA